MPGRVSLLEAVGRGAERPSEIAARLGTAQTNHSRLLQQLLVAEVKWRRLTGAERMNILRQLESKWSQSSLRARHRNVRFDVLDLSVLGGLTAGESNSRLREAASNLERMLSRMHVVQGWTWSVRYSSAL